MDRQSRVMIALLIATIFIWLLSTWAGIFGNLKLLELNKPLISLILGYLLWDLYDRTRS